MATSKYDVAVIGLGYIGLPTAACFAAKGKSVAGVDVNLRYVESVNKGEVPFVEPGLSDVLSAVVASEHLVAMSVVPKAKAYILALPTPLSESKGADLSYLTSAVQALAPNLDGGDLVVLESTSPPGTTRMLGELVVSLRPDLCLEPTEGKETVHFVHSPERVLPGRILLELESNDRVIGALTPAGAVMASNLYRIICSGSIHTTDASTAEMTKLVENTYRDVNIAFANELSIICDNLDIDVWDLIKLANHHPRVNILNPGPGVGGHCIAVDPWFIVDAFPVHAKLTRAAREVNEHKPNHVISQIISASSEFVDPRITLLGLSFKANIDDFRESPSLHIARRLAMEVVNSRISIVEPHIKELPRALKGLGNVVLADAQAAIDESDVVVLLVDHDAFRVVPTSSLKDKVVIDTKGFWRQDLMPVRNVLAGGNL